MLQGLQAPPVLTTDFFYIRFIGDRSIDDADFGKIQKDRVKEMQKWAKLVKKVIRNVAFGIVAANNHYAGFRPETANEFRKMIGHRPVVWEEMKQAGLD